MAAAVRIVYEASRKISSMREVVCAYIWIWTWFEIGRVSHQVYSNNVYMRVCMSIV